MVPPNLKFWFISSTESLESQQTHALRNRFLRTLFFQLKLLIPGTIGKCSRGKEHPFSTEFVLIMNSCFIQYNAPLVEYVDVAQQVNLFCQKWIIFCHFKINFIIFEVYTTSVTVHDNFQLDCISLEVYPFFLLPLYFNHFRQAFSSLESVFPMSGSCCI